MQSRMRLPGTCRDPALSRTGDPRTHLMRGQMVCRMSRTDSISRNPECIPMHAPCFGRQHAVTNPDGSTTSTHLNVDQARTQPRVPAVDHRRRNCEHTPEQDETAACITQALSVAITSIRPRPSINYRNFQGRRIINVSFV